MPVAIDHTSLAVPSAKVNDEVAFLTESLSYTGFKEMMRPCFNVVGLGAGIPFLWVSGRGAGGKELTEADLPPAGTVHLALTAEDQDEVDAWYEAAIKAGGKDNGKPGLRPDYHPYYYAAFVISPGGINYEVVHHAGKRRNKA